MIENFHVEWDLMIQKNVFNTGMASFCCSNILCSNFFLSHTRYGGGNSTSAEEVSRFQRLFPNPSWLV